MNKENLQQQLNEMKTKVAEMEAELNRPKKFELEYEKDKTYLVDLHRVISKCTGTNSEYMYNGRYRQTKEAAELSLARNRRANRLEALVEQVGSLKEFVENEKNYIVFYRYEDNTYATNYSSCIYSPERVYMMEATAIKVCEILNAGEYEL